MHVRLAAPVLAALLAAPLQAQSVWVVDHFAGAGHDFTNFADALAAANDGDTLLVRGGTYAEDLVIDGRSIDVVAEETNLVIVRGLQVRNVAAGQSVIVHGIETLPLTIVAGASLVVSDCTGPVMLEECIFRSGEQVLPTAGTGGKFIRDSTAVTIARCRFEAESFLQLPGLLIEDSRVALFEAELEGRDGIAADFFTPIVPPTPALELRATHATLSACELIGGDGAAGFNGGHFPTCNDGGDGAPALLVGGATPSNATLLDCDLLPGAGGLASPFFCPGTVDGAAGARIELVNGTAAEPTVHAPTYILGSPLRSGAPLFFVIEGAPQSTTWVRIGFGPGTHLGHPILEGLLTVGAPDLMLPFFPSGVDGTISYQTLPGTLILPPGVPHLTFVFQHLFFEPTNGLVAGSPASLLVLDPNLY